MQYFFNNSIGIEMSNGWLDLQNPVAFSQDQCLGWSERRNHLAGALGSAMAEQLFERGWIQRMRETARFESPSLVIAN
jgi:hypothetical protein